MKLVFSLYAVAAPTAPMDGARFQMARQQEVGEIPVGEGRSRLHAWTLAQLAQGYDCGLYSAAFELLDEERDVEECFREELVLWNCDEEVFHRAQDFGDR